MEFIVVHLGQAFAYLEILNVESGAAHIQSWVTQMEQEDEHIGPNHQRRTWQADRADIEMNLFHPCLDPAWRPQAYEWATRTYADRWEWLYVFSTRFMMLWDKGHIIQYISLENVPVFSNVLCILEDQPDWIDRNGAFHLWEDRQPFVWSQCPSYYEYRTNDLPVLDEIIQYTRHSTWALLPIKMRKNLSSDWWQLPPVSG